jgi:hypothetical protein
LRIHNGLTKIICNVIYAGIVTGTFPVADEVIGIGADGGVTGAIGIVVIGLIIGAGVAWTTVGID